MEEGKHISQYRDRLDKTLEAHELSDVKSLKRLVRDQMQRSIMSELTESTEKIAEDRTEELFNCVQLLKSASGDAEKGKDTHQRGWKLKQDTEEYRVMYREGPEGTPFHSLLLEGYVDGPLDVCLCIALESELYKKWWPQSSIPTFKVLASECLQKVRIGEQICLVRVKVPWPLSSREAIVHFFEFEYFQDDLIVVLFNSITDLESDDRSFEGFSKDAIPDSKDVISIDLLGGMAIQKVSATRSYFRTIANMDIKLDFVPPSIINFISRQLMGSGFMLFKKEVASVSKEVRKGENMEGTSTAVRISFGSRSSRQIGSELYIREENHSNKIVPSPIEVNPLNPSQSHNLSLQDEFYIHKNDVDLSFAIDNNKEVHDKRQARGTKIKAKHRKLRRLCCLHTISE